MKQISWRGWPSCNINRSLFKGLWPRMGLGRSRDLYHTVWGESLPFLTLYMSDELEFRTLFIRSRNSLGFSSAKNKGHYLLILYTMYTVCNKHTGTLNIDYSLNKMNCTKLKIHFFERLGLFVCQKVNKAQSLFSLLHQISGVVLTLISSKILSYVTISFWIGSRILLLKGFPNRQSFSMQAVKIRLTPPLLETKCPHDCATQLLFK